jgi:hypothetical protein
MSTAAEAPVKASVILALMRLDVTNQTNPSHILMDNNT